MHSYILVNGNKKSVWKKLCFCYLSKKGVTLVQANSTKIGSQKITYKLLAGPIAEGSKSSDHGRGDPGSNPGEGRFFSAFFQDGELS